MSQEWYVQMDGEILGPLDSEGLQFAVDQGAVQRDTLIRLGERGNWNPAESIIGIFPASEPVPVFIPKARQPERMVPASQVAPQVAVSVSRVQKGWCPQCNASTVLAVHPANHLLHFIVSIVTGGIWLPVWIVIACAPEMNCTICGGRGFSNKTSRAAWTAFRIAFWSVAAIILVPTGLIFLYAVFSVLLGKGH